MKNILLALGLIATLSGCSKKSDDPAIVADPFLGHWQSDTSRSVWYFKDGTVNHDNTLADVNKLDITPTTLTFTYVDSKGKAYVDVYPYTRSGEALSVPTWGEAGAKLSAKGLTPTNFTFEEYVPHPNTGGWAVGTHPFHR